MAFLEGQEISYFDRLKKTLLTANQTFYVPAFIGKVLSPSQCKLGFKKKNVALPWVRSSFGPFMSRVTVIRELRKVVRRNTFRSKRRVWYLGLKAWEGLGSVQISKGCVLVVFDQGFIVE